jgi:hypothetical protein
MLWRVAMSCLLGCAGCAHESATPSSSSATPASGPSEARRAGELWALATAEPIDPSLAEHFGIALWTRQATIEGRLEQVREPLRAFAQYRYAALEPSDWAAAIADLQRTAASIANAPTLAQAAAGVAHMAQLCGACHAANAARAAPERIIQRPAWFGAANLLQRMDSHQWAADQLWHGLVDPSNAAWDAGAKALSRIEPQASDPAFGALSAPGRAALSAQTPETRASAYGMLLATCATCHQARRPLP